MVRARIFKLAKISFIVSLVCLCLFFFVGITFLGVGFSMRNLAQKGQHEFDTLNVTFLIIGGICFALGVTNTLTLISAQLIKKLSPFVTERAEIREFAIMLTVFGAVSCFYPVYAGIQILKYQDEDYPPLDKVINQ